MTAESSRSITYGSLLTRAAQWSGVFLSPSDEESRAGSSRQLFTMRGVAFSKKACVLKLWQSGDGLWLRQPGPHRAPRRRAK